jgi:hypothetical protein
MAGSYVYDAHGELLIKGPTGELLQVRCPGASSKLVGVEPVDPVQASRLDVLDIAPGPSERMSSVLQARIWDSASGCSSRRPDRILGVLLV